MLPEYDSYRGSELASFKAKPASSYAGLVVKVSV